MPVPRVKTLFPKRCIPPVTSTSSPLISARQVSKAFGESHVLDRIDFEAQSGEVIALIGPSGAGKSTLLRCCNLLERPDAGQLTILDQSFTFPEDQGLPDSHLAPLRARIGFIFQSFNLWPHLTVADNVAAAPKTVLKLGRAEALDLAHSMLDRVALRDQADKHPLALSGGQQQRVAIARALAMQPDVLLFDEPTSALDPELVGEVLTVMNDLAQEGRTMVIVTHELQFARDVASRLVFMDQGRIVEQGAPDTVMSQPTTDRLTEFLARHVGR